MLNKIVQTLSKVVATSYKMSFWKRHSFNIFFHLKTLLTMLHLWLFKIFINWTLFILQRLINKVYNLYWHFSLVRLLVRGDRWCGKRPEWLEKTHVSKGATTIPCHIQPLSITVSNPGRSGDKRVLGYVIFIHFFFLDTLIDIKSYSSGSLSVTVGITVGTCVFVVIGIVLASIAIR